MSTYYCLPTRNVFGAGSVSEVGALMDSLGGKRTMIVTDSFLAAHPMTAGIQEILKSPASNPPCSAGQSRTPRIPM